LRSRFDLSRRGSQESEAALGLTGVDCITLREERRIEEAPAAYKPITPVIDAQVQAGLVQVVARMRPILTFKA
jgi:tRNA-splicing ligase RtcB (3'-phosphate/5'-hydroxy nucleic acid ligase)